jgi:hypothetical protein
MEPDDEVTELVRKFRTAGDRLQSRGEYADKEMGELDEAQRQRLAALQDLVERFSAEGAAQILGLTARDVEDELRHDRAIE